MNTLLLLMILAPLAGSILNGLVLRPAFARRAGTLATLASGISFVCAVLMFLQVGSGDISVSFPWFSAGSLDLKWGFRFDQLTAVMALVVTGIGTVIHLYSIGYMSEEPGPYRYFAYLNLFLFNMLVLISADNVVGLFVGWEGVGLCSYLLIGYWYADPEKAKAGMKAFIVNRIGDAGFLLGMFLLFQLFGSLDFQTIVTAVKGQMGLNLSVLNLAAFFLFVGATGKSAQIPLFVWLPDAMAGPTPVSALIHAATMVTAGVYMIARLEPVFALAAGTNVLIAYVGLATALLAGLIATSQRDIKKVLAYSTVSQLGFMFLALGCKAYVAAIFHLMTHAFFKALLFLGSGSVIHGLHGEQDVANMGGLRKALPWTFWTFAIGTVAICGIPPLAGFFSKDTILHAALVTDSKLWIGGLCAATLTSFYMARLLALTFLGSYRGHAHPHESPMVMLLPLVILAVGSVFAGFLGSPEELHLGPNFIEHFLGPVLPAGPEGEGFISSGVAMLLTTLVGFSSFLFGWYLYENPKRAEAVLAPLKSAQKVFYNKFWVDELYGLVFVRPFEFLSDIFSRIFDPKVVDGTVLIGTEMVRGVGGLLSWFQWGAVQFYLLVMLLGAVYVFWFVLRGTVL